MKTILTAFCCVISFAANSQQIEQPKKLSDTVKKDLFTAPDSVKKLHSKAYSLIIPASLISYGALSFVIHPIRQLDYDVQRGVQYTDASFHSKAESYFQFSPVIAVYALNLAGVEGKNRFIDRTALLALSGGILGLTAGITKKATHRLRPNNGDYLSFPSGHTSTAFAGAEFLAQEYSDKSAWYGVAGYAVAATTGVFRLYNPDHWFSDVIAGSGFGMLSTKAAYLLYPYIRNAVTHKDKKGRSTMWMPNYQDGMIGFSFAKEL